MDMGTILRLVLMAVVVFIAVKILLWLLHVVVGVLSFALVALIIFAVVWLIFSLVTRRAAY